jgi:hypothetical protein
VFVRFAFVVVLPPRFALLLRFPVFVFVVIGVDVAIGVALTMTAVFALAFALRMLAFVFTLTAVSPQAVKPATASESAIKDPVFLIVVSSDISKNLKTAQNN